MPYNNDPVPPAQISLKPNNNNVTSYLKIYELHHNYVLRELGLINNRITWILTIHGFLYAIYGLTIQKQIEITTNPVFISGYTTCNSDQVFYSLTLSEAFLFVISLVGMLISLFGYISISAACNAMGAVASIFDQKNIAQDEHGSVFYNKKEARFYKKYGLYLPNLLGGGPIKNNNYGNWASKSIPCVLLISWFFSMASIMFACYVNRLLLCKFPEFAWLHKYLNPM